MGRRRLPDLRLLGPGQRLRHPLYRRRNPGLLHRTRWQERSALGLVQPRHRAALRRSRAHHRLVVLQSHHRRGNLLFSIRDYPHLYPPPRERGQAQLLRASAARVHHYIHQRVLHPLQGSQGSARQPQLAHLPVGLGCGSLRSLLQHRELLRGPVHHDAGGGARLPHAEGDGGPRQASRRFRVRHPERNHLHPGDLQLHP